MGSKFCGGGHQMGNKFCGEATRWVVSSVGRPPDG